LIFVPLSASPSPIECLSNDRHQEQSFNNDHKTLIGNRPSGPCIIARMEPTARSKSCGVAPATQESGLGLVIMEA
jgi:hypothetical protein